jgi:hypothetical protein
MENRHPNRNQYPVRLSVPERDLLVEVIDTAIARLVNRGRNPAILRRIRDKVAAIGGEPAPRGLPGASKETDQ